MGGTGLEPVTPSLSIIFGDGDVPRASPLFPAQIDFWLPQLCLVMRRQFGSFVRLLRVGERAASSSDKRTLGSVSLVSRERPDMLGGS